MTDNAAMNARLRQALTPKHDLNTLGTSRADQDGAQDQGTPQGTGSPSGGPPDTPEPPRRRVNHDAGEGRGPDGSPWSWDSSHAAMNQTLREAVRNKPRP